MQNSIKLTNIIDSENIIAFEINQAIQGLSLCYLQTKVVVILLLFWVYSLNFHNLKNFMAACITCMCIHANYSNANTK